MANNDVDRGVIVENMSTNKLVYISVVLLLFQIATFLIGAIVSPAPNTSMSYLATKCVDMDGNVSSDELFFPRGHGSCDRIDAFDSVEANHLELTAENIVFAFQMPHPRDGVQIDYSRWQQQMMAILLLDIEYEVDDEEENKSKEQSDDSPVELVISAKLAYKNKLPNGRETRWHQMERAVIDRTMTCSIDDDMKRSGYFYNCSMINLFELGSLHHDFYLLNLRLPSVVDRSDGAGVRQVNENLGKLIDLHLITIVQNGGFTKVWVGLKSFFCPIIAGELLWFWMRVSSLSRSTWSPIECSLMALASSLVLLDVPFEYLTLTHNMPWLPLFNDIKQGLFYGMLMIFWIVFVGEHGINDAVTSNEPTFSYARKLALVLFGCCCLFVFDIFDRGIQLKNVFHSLWATEFGSQFAMCFISLAAISAALFFLTLCIMIYKVFLNISSKRASISAMSRVRRVYYEGLIWRFRVLMVATLLTAALTTATFILGQVQDNGNFDFEHQISVQYTSGFLTGVYGMWNIYVFGVLFLYAPSHRNKPTRSQSVQRLDPDGPGEVVRSLSSTLSTSEQSGSTLNHLQSAKESAVSVDSQWTELSVMADFLQHKSVD